MNSLSKKIKVLHIVKNPFFFLHYFLLIYYVHALLPLWALTNTYLSSVMKEQVPVVIKWLKKMSSDELQVLKHILNEANILNEKPRILTARFTFGFCLLRRPYNLHIFNFACLEKFENMFHCFSDDFLIYCFKN